MRTYDPMDDNFRVKRIIPRYFSKLCSRCHHRFIKESIYRVTAYIYVSTKTDYICMNCSGYSAYGAIISLYPIPSVDVQKRLEGYYEFQEKKLRT